MNEAFIFANNLKDIKIFDNGIYGVYRACNFIRRHARTFYSGVESCEV